jgi:hypothetical protein
MNEGEVRAEVGEIAMEKWLCLSAMILAGLLLVLFGLDLALGVPFGRKAITNDILFIIAGGLVLWQGYETWREVA